MNALRLTDEQLVIAEIQPRPGDTASRWTVLPHRVLELDWAEIALLAVQHRVEGILEEALKIHGCADQVSPSVLSLLRRRADLAEARYIGCYDALVELNRIASAVVAELVFFKGATLTPLYDAPHHRMVGDFDFIVPSGLYPDLRAALGRLGFWEKPGRNGPTFFGEVRNPKSGGEYVAFDVHLDAPPKYNRTDASIQRVWQNATEPHMIGEVACRRLERDLELLELLIHASEHAARWIHICLKAVNERLWVIEDDIRLIRLLDVELLCAGGGVKADRVTELSSQLCLEGELALGLAQLAAVRGGLPAPLGELRHLADAAAELVDAVALPDGRIVTWAAPIRQRAFTTDRASRALLMMPPDRRHRDDWFDWRQGLTNGKEDVAEIARRLQEALRPLSR